MQKKWRLAKIIKCIINWKGNMCRLGYGILKKKKGAGVGGGGGGNSVCMYVNLYVCYVPMPYSGFQSFLRVFTQISPLFDTLGWNIFVIKKPKNSYNEDT